jgi:hypothetical protein
MTTKPRMENTSNSSPGQSDRREQLLRIYDELDDAGKQELLRLAQDLLLIYCALARQSVRILYPGGLVFSGFILSRTQPTSAGLYGSPCIRENRPSK